MKKFLESHRTLVLFFTIFPFAAIYQVYPINLIFLIIQIFCFAAMFWIGWAEKK